MTTTSTGAPAQAGASGRSGAKKPKTTTKKKSNTLEIRGVTLNLPERVPMRIFKQMVGIARAGDEAQVEDMINALEMVLGPEETEKVWDMEVETGNGTLDSIQDLFAEVIDKVFVATGITPGESKASP